ncbi:MAG TPA: hypothetical protein VI819_01870 [Patescibacteria group bacterium]|nr:hypothetical protein [Patescibacteria group bacterium]
MSPKIEIYNIDSSRDVGSYSQGLVADLLDVTGTYDTQKGSITIEMNPPESAKRPYCIAVTWGGFEGHFRDITKHMNPETKRVLYGSRIEGYYANPRRVIDLNRKTGVGEQNLDGSGNILRVTLNDRTE